MAGHQLTPLLQESLFNSLKVEKFRNRKMRQHHREKSCFTITLALPGERHDRTGRLKNLALILLLTLPVGWLAGQAWNRREKHQPDRELDHAPAHSGSMRDRSPSLPAPTAESMLATLRAPVNEHDTRPLAKVLSDWSEEEIIAALEACIADPAFHGMPDSQYGPTVQLIAEWKHRNLPALLDWFKGLESHRLKSKLANVVARDWPEGHESLAHDFLFENHGPITGVSALGSIVVNRAIQGGPSEMNALLKRLREEDFLISFYGADFPDDFDFQGLVNSGELERYLKAEGNPAIMSYWISQDRDAAFQWVVDHMDGEGFGEFITEDEEQATWLGSKYETLPADQRTQLIEAIFKGNRNNSNFDPESLGTAISTPSLRMEMWKHLIVEMRETGISDTDEPLVFLERWKTPNVRLEILENIELGELGFTPEMDIELVRTRLRGWTGDEERIEAIVKRLKP